MIDKANQDLFNLGCWQCPGVQKGLGSSGDLIAFIYFDLSWCLSDFMVHKPAGQLKMSDAKSTYGGQNREKLQKKEKIVFLSFA